MENNDLVVFKFNNIEIPFALDAGPDNMMICITDLMKASGKKIAEWKRLPSTKAYLDEVLIEMGFSHINQIIYSEKSGNPGQRGGGKTWVHQLVFIEIARYISPKFSVWCNKTIIQVLKDRFGIEMNKLNSKVNSLLNDISTITAQANNLQNQLKAQQPKIDYYNNVLQSSEPLYSTRQLVKQLGLKVSNIQLLRKMADDDLIYKESDNQWYIKGPFAKFRYRISTTIKDPKTGKYMTVNKWTEAGKQWIDSLAITWKMK